MTTFQNTLRRSGLRSGRALLSLLMWVPALCLAQPSLAQPVTQIEVFTEGPVDLPRLPYTTITHYDLLAPEQIKRGLPRLTTKDEQAAATQVQRWIDSPEGSAFAERMRSAYLGREKAMQYALEKTPAIVFDQGEYVVYGSINIRRALLLYRQQ